MRGAVGPWLLGMLFMMGAEAIVHGDPVEWSRHGYLVKVMATDQNNMTKLCTGSIISGSLILTSADCVVDPTTQEPMAEFSVIVLINNYKRHHLAILVQKTELWAVLRIKTIPSKLLCPKAPRPARVLRVNLKPNLHEMAQLEVPTSQIMDGTCYLIGFSSIEDPMEFPRNKGAFRLDLEPLNYPRSGEVLYTSVITNNATACYEDAGAPLVCNTAQHGTLLSGLFVTLGAVLGEENEQKVAKQPTAATLDVCTGAYEMQFGLIQADDRLWRLIEAEDLGPFVDVYHRCGYVHPPEQE